MALADSDIAGPSSSAAGRARWFAGGARLRRDTCHSDSATAASATKSTAGSVTQ